MAKAAAAAAETASESAAAGSCAVDAFASAADSVTQQMVAAFYESKAVMQAHVSSILAAAVIEGSQMVANNGEAAATADVALQLFMTAQQKMSSEVDRLVESSKPRIHRLVSIGAKLGEMSAAASKRQVQISEDADYRKVRGWMVYLFRLIVCRDLLDSSPILRVYRF